MNGQWPPATDMYGSKVTGFGVAAAITGMAATGKEQGPAGPGMPDIGIIQQEATIGTTDIGDKALKGLFEHEAIDTRRVGVKKIF